MLDARPGVEPATDDWPFLYLRDRHLPRHYLVGARAHPGRLGRRGDARVLRGAGGHVVVAVLPARRRLHAARDEVDHPVRAAVGLDLGRRVARDRLGAGDGARRELRRRRESRSAGRGWSAPCCSALLALNYLIPIGRIGFESRALESLFYAVLMFSPILCAGLLFGSAIKRSTSLARDYGTNLLGAMVGGVGEYLSLVTGFRALLLLIALCYIGAIAARRKA